MGRSIDLGAAARWTVEPVGGDLPEHIALPAELPPPVPATVPGTVQTDLMAAGLLADPHLGLAEADVQWAGYLDWTWTGRFPLEPVAPGEEVDLEFDGIDTVGVVALNGTEVLRTLDMHQRHRVRVTDLIVAGENVLTVRISSAIGYARQRLAEYGYLPQDYEHPYNFVRKAACSFGWDWGPTVVTAGIWRPVRLRRWRGARLGDVLVRADMRPGEPDGVVVVDPAVLGAPADVVVTVRDPEGHVVARGTGDGPISVPVAAPRRWWPRGYGEQVLYTVEVDLSGDRHTARVGFRSVRLATEPDEIGREFVLHVNDRPVFVRGAAWVPLDTILPRITPQLYAQRVRDAAEANLNLLRVWGGGVYEDRAFYEACDEQGLLVWQDFMFACAAYPQDPAFVDLVRAEAADVLNRIAPHPSVVLLCGSNENQVAAVDWGWAERAPNLPWGEVLDDEVLPAVAREVLPLHPYVPSTPTSLDPEVHPNDPDHATTHQWDVWNRLDPVHYRDCVPRFAAEFGFQAPASLGTLARAAGQEPDDPRGPFMRAHQKQGGGVEKLDRNLAEYTAPASSLRRFADWHLATSLTQAWALRIAITHLRSWWPRCAGLVLWQLNDCWPVSSWAIVDGDGVRKPAWHAVRRACAPRLVTFQPRPDGMILALVNDTDSLWTTAVVLSRRHVDGRVLAEAGDEVSVPARSVLTLPVPREIRAARRRREEVLVAEADGLRDVEFFVPRNALLVPPAQHDVSIRHDEVTVLAQTFSLDTLLLADADDGLVTLFPGERHTFRVTDPGDHLVRCANEVIRLA